MKNEKRLESVWWALRIGLGLGPILAGLDKFFNVLADWNAYLSPVAETLLPISGPVFMRVVGIVEIAVGLLVLTRWTRLGAYVAMGWLTAIAANLATMGMFDIAVRDLEIAIAAYALARLTEAREETILSLPRARSGPGSALDHFGRVTARELMPGPRSESGAEPGKGGREGCASSVPEEDGTKTDRPVAEGT